MSRILLLVLVLIWMAGPPEHGVWSNVNLALFFSFYIALVLMLGLWSRMLARRVATGNFHRRVEVFNKVMFGARIMIPVWFTVGVWGLGWGGALMKVLGDGMYRSAPGMLLGTMPAFATWMGLWWSQYPAERALREQNLLVELDNDLPIYRPPPFRSYFFSNFRLQVLFTLLPVAMIVLVRDTLMWSAFWLAGQPLNSVSPKLETFASLFSAGAVFLFAPPLLARVLSTSPMADCPLRQKLDAMCRRAGIRYRHILVWNTNNHVGNAAVMGVLPGLRYVLLSDVLLERMSDKQIEAVFAHELGHVVYRHMTWYAVFFVFIMFGTGLTWLAYSWLANSARMPLLGDPTLEGIASAAGVAGFLLLFGGLSRKCERQADVYAARTMQLMQSDPVFATGAGQNPQQPILGSAPVVEPRSANHAPVGEQGAALFVSALRRVATINNIPIHPSERAEPGLWNQLAHHADAMLDLANNWLHGSIASRMQYVQDLGADPQLTRQFDRSMYWVYLALLCALISSVMLSALFSSSI